ncbi:hypothetical protein L6452_22316 [Arctium lappa]|uniref:Uncharacterized protein n=1 Tax=Arctium lappa TaxID=4217 RepID=A0ACB9AYV6_ARCLA|nr:hypothetical protein L6452_22316 [Arctium lappa]
MYINISTSRWHTTNAKHTLLCDRTKMGIEVGESSGAEASSSREDADPGTAPTSTSNVVRRRFPLAAQPELEQDFADSAMDKPWCLVEKEVGVGD